MSYIIGQTFTDSYPPQSAIWCNKNNAYIEKNGNTYTIVAVPEPPAPTAQDIINSYDKRIEAWIDEMANTRNYRTADSCVSYVGDKDPTFDREARAFKDWRSDVYSTCRGLIAQYIGGDIADVPPVEEIIAQLPQLDWNDPVEEVQE